MGIRDRPISPRSPWQNGYAERLIGTLAANAWTTSLSSAKRTCGEFCPRMQTITIKRARTWLCRRMRRYGEPFSGLAA